MSKTMDSKKRSKTFHTPEALAKWEKQHREVQLKLERVIKMAIKCPDIRTKLIEIKEMI
jgi:hypothetical protein